MVKRVHKELNRGLKLLLPDPPNGWVQAITLLVFAYNSQIAKYGFLRPGIFSSADATTAAG